MKIMLQSKIGPLILTAVALLWLGCAQVNQFENEENKSSLQIQMLQEQSSGQIPCPPEKIEITEYHFNKSDGKEYWTAFGCDGGTYSCTRSGKDNAANCERADPDLMN